MKPLYDCQEYKDFCKIQKEKGLRKELWKELPEMWQRELEFREEFESALLNFSLDDEEKLCSLN